MDGYIVHYNNICIQKIGTSYYDLYNDRCDFEMLHRGRVQLITFFLLLCSYLFEIAAAVVYRNRFNDLNETEK